MKSARWFELKVLAESRRTLINGPLYMTIRWEDWDRIAAVVDAAKSLRDNIREEYPTCPDAEYVDAVTTALAELGVE